MLQLSEKAKKVKASSTLAITAKAKELKAQGVDIVGFGAGEPDFPTPEHIADAAIQAIHTGFTKYTPASGTEELKQAISKKFQVFNGLTYQPQQIVISNGGKHALTNIFTAILNPGEEVLIPVPYWLSYPEMVRLADGVPVFLDCKQENEYKVTPEQLAQACTSRTKALILNSPCNPTGMVYTAEELKAIAQVAIEKDFYIIADEMYEYLTYDGAKHVSIASLGKEIYERTITCSGLSKSYAMTGWRIGYIGAPEEIAKCIANIQSHQTSNPNSIAQKAAVAALLGPQDAIETMRQAFDERRQYMRERIQQMPLVRAVQPKGAFYYFLDVSKALTKQLHGKPIETIENLAYLLLTEYNIAVVPCTDFGAADHIRLSYAIAMDQMIKGMDRLEQFLNSLQ